MIFALCAGEHSPVQVPLRLFGVLDKTNRAEAEAPPKAMPHEEGQRAELTYSLRYTEGETPKFFTKSLEK